MRISDWSSDVCSSDLLKYAGEASRLVIGRRNTIREHVTMNPGTAGGGMETRVGDDCLFMVGAHVAHDCRIGDRVVLANTATLAGHVAVQDDAILGGLTGVPPHVRSEVRRVGKGCVRKGKYGWAR